VDRLKLARVELRLVSCAECLYWRRPAAGSRRGECRRRAPAPGAAEPGAEVISARERTAAWPLTLASDGCGDGMAPAALVPAPPPG
jgi:hypothetical protein